TPICGKPSRRRRKTRFPPGARRRLRWTPQSQVGRSRGDTSYGLGGQEAPQAHGQEEASQAAAQDQGPASPSRQVSSRPVSAAHPNAGGRAAMKEQNVIGTMQLLAACQQAPELRKVVFRSSTAAYGVSFRDPAVFTEDTEPRDTPRGGFARDVLDIEGYLRGFRRRRSDVAVTVLRFAPLIGRRANTSLTRYFSRAVVPTVLGRDPRLQFVHVDDALEILHRAVTEDHPG